MANGAEMSPLKNISANRVITKRKGFSGIEWSALDWGLFGVPLAGCHKIGSTPSVPVLSGSKRIVIFSPYFMGIDLFYQLFQVIFFLDEIYLIGINDQEGSFGIIKKEIIEGLIHFVQIFGIDEWFIVPVPFFNPVQQNARVCLQENDEIRLGNLLG